MCIVIIAGVDGITPKDLIQCVDEIVLTKVINFSIFTGIYTDGLRIAIVFKTGSEQNVSNYWPISTLSCLNKIFEKVLYNRIVSFRNSQENFILNITLLGLNVGADKLDFIKY